jgi:hypothetical protein
MAALPAINWNVILCGAIRESDTGLMYLAIQKGADGWTNALVAAASVGRVDLMIDMQARGASSIPIEAQEAAAKGNHTDVLAWLKRQPDCIIDWCRVLVAACAGGHCVLAQQAAAMQAPDEETLDYAFEAAVKSDDDATIRLIYGINTHETEFTYYLSDDCLFLIRLFERERPPTSRTLVVLHEIGAKIGKKTWIAAAMSHGRATLSALINAGYIMPPSLHSYCKSATIDTLVFILEQAKAPLGLEEWMVMRLLRHPEHAISLYTRGHLHGQVDSEYECYHEFIYLLQRHQVMQDQLHTLLLALTPLPLVLCDLVVGCC